MLGGFPSWENPGIMSRIEEFFAIATTEQRLKVRWLTHEIRPEANHRFAKDSADLMHDYARLGLWDFISKHDTDDSIDQSPYCSLCRDLKLVTIFAHT